MRLSDRAYRLIRHQIVTLDLPPNSPIDEAGLMRDLELGRTPIREALHRLSAEGLVLLAPRRGMSVSDIGLTDLQNLFEMRLVLESFSAELAAVRATSEQVAAMNALMHELKTSDELCPKDLMAIDEQYHELIYQASHNELLAETSRRLHAQSLRIWHLLLDRLGSVRPAMEQHLDITRAIEEHNAKLAASLIEVHISEFHKQVKACL